MGLHPHAGRRRDLLPHLLVVIGVRRFGVYRRRTLLELLHDHLHRFFEFAVSDSEGEPGLAAVQPELGFGGVDNLHL